MKPDTGSVYASKDVNFLRMGARSDTHQKLSTFQGLTCIEKCQLSKKMDTHRTHYPSKSVNFPREISTKSVFAELVYQKKTAVTLQASHRWEEDGSGKDDTYHPLAAMHWGLGTVPPFLLRSGAWLSSLWLSHAAAFLQSPLSIQDHHRHLRGAGPVTSGVAGR
jgi:hypothetical protein